ncbi:outer membrane beta-barrel protein [Spirosoma sp. HMF3257]|uniref:Outer membrane protein beta-barrel domain-containing protein n=1 Tax=Spirosoma telluris TaxID=2183553 RepID=A0A327NS93_9BACT|nr:outer membrane beta-barrel protein [Spirosoma telluris]RAI78132.1 hypothetical protein HMF3257_35855 [Spirosoma telluris]
MKTKLKIVIFLSLINLLEGYGQTGTRFGITFGPSAGQVQASLTLNDILLRYKVGIAFEQQFTRNFALASELNYSRQGSRYTSTNGYVSDKYITAIDYISLPVLLRFRAKNERGFVEAGGQVGYLVSANSYHSSDKEKTFSVMQHTNKIDVGITGGVGYRLGSHVAVDLRYYYGMQPIRQNYTAPLPKLEFLLITELRSCITEYGHSIYSIIFSH